MQAPASASWKALPPVVKGTIFGVLTLVVTGVQPILAQARPSVLDGMYFSFATMFFELLMFLPLLAIERRIAKPLGIKHATGKAPVSWRRVARMLGIASCFALALPLFFLGFDLTDATTGSIVIKSSVLFSLAYGYLIINERVTRRQVLFSVVMIMGLMVVVSGGAVDGLLLNVGALILVLVPLLWTIGHGLTRPMLRDGQTTGPAMVVTRNAFGSAVMLLLYLSMFPVSNLGWLLVPEYLGASLVMAASYAAGHYGWYKAITYMDLNKAMIIVAPTPVITGIVEYLVFGKLVSIYDVLGTIIVLACIVVIFKERERRAPT